MSSDDLRCGFCRKPAAKAPFARLWPWAGGEWRCVRCLRCEEEDARRERTLLRGELAHVGGRDPWQDEWLASPELYHLLREQVVALGQPCGQALDGTLYVVGQGYDIQAHAWLSATGIIIAYPHLLFPTSDESSEWEDWIHHLFHSDPLELGLARERSSYGALDSPHPTALPILKWGQTGDWMGLIAGTMWHGEEY